MALRPSFVPLRLPLLSPPASSLADAIVVTDPSFDSTAASALVAELVDFAAACRLDYADSLVAESESDCPLSVGGECALGTDVLEDRQEDFECLAATVPHLVATLLAPEGDPNAPDISTPRLYAEAIQVLQHFDFWYSSPQSTPLPIGHSLSAHPSDESIEPSGPYPELVGCLISSCEAEIYAGAMAAQELRGLTYMLTGLGERPRSSLVLYINNNAMIVLCQEHRPEHRTKHIALCYFLARELQQRGQLRLAYVATQANTADIFTKALQSASSGGAGIGGTGTGGASSGGAGAGGAGTKETGARGLPTASPTARPYRHDNRFQAFCRLEREEQERVEQERQELQQLDQQQQQQQTPQPPPWQQLFPP
ncbi:unnamed protein product [Closterium sp. NIES-54]